MHDGVFWEERDRTADETSLGSGIWGSGRGDTVLLYETGSGTEDHDPDGEGGCCRRRQHVITTW